MSDPNKDDKISAQEQPGKKDFRSSPAVSENNMQERLGLGLKNMYRSVLEEPLPEEMLTLLDQLDDSDDDSKSASGSNPDD